MKAAMLVSGVVVTITEVVDGLIVVVIVTVVVDAIVVVVLNKWVTVVTAVDVTVSLLETMVKELTGIIHCVLLVVGSANNRTSYYTEHNMQ